MFVTYTTVTQGSKLTGGTPVVVRPMYSTASVVTYNNQAQVRSCATPCVQHASVSGTVNATKVVQQTVPSQLTCEESNYCTTTSNSVVESRPRIAPIQAAVKQVPSLSEATEPNPVCDFLQEIGLSQYEEVLLSNGYDDLETLSDLSELEMRDLGILRGHAAKLHKNLRRDLASKQGSMNTCRESVGKEGSIMTAAASSRSTRITRPTDEGLVTKQLSHASTGLASIVSLDSDAKMSPLRRSWEIVQAIGVENVAERLYKNFFILYPEAFELFPAERLQKYRDWEPTEGSSEEALDRAAMRKFWAKIVNIVGGCVAGLHSADKIFPVLRKLGKSGMKYANSEKDWERVGNTLTMTMRELLGDDFTSDVEEGWTITVSFIKAVMVSGLRDAQRTAQGLHGHPLEATLGVDHFSDTSSVSTFAP